jgi:hypothetical protein
MTPSPTTLGTTARKLAVAAALSFAGIAGFAGAAAADTPPFVPDLPLADPCGQAPGGCEQPEPDPEPPVLDDLPLADPCGQLPEGCEQPDPDPEPPVDPDLPLTDDPCNHLSHGCGEDPEIDDFETPTDVPDEEEPEGEEPEGEEPDEEEPGDTDDADEQAGDPKGGQDADADDEGRGDLPRTGTGIAPLVGAGTLLVGSGVAARLLARRRS